MDELAGRYVTLCLRLARLHPAVVSSYAGPDRLVAAVADEPRRPPHTLANDADRLAADVAGEPTLPEDRADWLVQQLVALGTVARHLAGERLPFRQLARRLTGVPPRAPARSLFEKARGRLDEIVPGAGPVRDRLEAVDRLLLVEVDAVPGLLRRQAARLRARAQARYRLPGDAVLEVVRAQVPSTGARPATHRYLGGHRGRLEVTIPGPVHAFDVQEAAEALGWPGRHAEHLLRETLLVEEFGRGELTVVADLTPQRLISAGIAAHAARMLYRDGERQQVARELLAQLRAGVPADDALAIVAARPPLADTLALAALRRHVDGWATADCADLLARTSLRPRAWCTAAAAALADPWVAARSLADAAGARRVGAHLAAQPDPPAAFRRLLTTQLTPSALAAP